MECVVHLPLLPNSGRSGAPGSLFKGLRARNKSGPAPHRIHTPMDIAILISSALGASLETVIVPITDWNPLRVTLNL